MSNYKKYSNWSEAEKAFVYAPYDGPRVTLKTISERFGIPYTTVRGKAAAEKWTLKRLNYELPIRQARRYQNSKI